MSRTQQHQTIPSAAALQEAKAALSSTHNDDSSDMDMDGDSDCDNFMLDPEDPNGVWRHIQEKQVFQDPLETSASEKQPCCTRFVLMSDTHGKHRMIRPPPGDVLIHAGDFTKMGEPGTIKDLNEYFREMKGSFFRDVICVAGNHDITLDADFYIRNWTSFFRRNQGKKPYDEHETQTYLRDCIYLRDSSCRTTVGELEIYGSPMSPTYGCWAFGMIRGAPIRRIWEGIPSSTDILITHGPPLGRGDATFHSGRAGCYDLLQEVQRRIRPRLHVFGHIHEGHGSTYDGHTLFVNAASVDLQYQPTHYCIVVDVPHDPTQMAKLVRPECPIATTDQFTEWLESHQGYDRLVECAKSARHLTGLPLGNALFHEDSYRTVCSILDLYRDANARNDWQRAAMEIYSESFPRT